MVTICSSFEKTKQKQTIKPVEMKCDTNEILIKTMKLDFELLWSKIL